MRGNSGIRENSDERRAAAPPAEFSRIPLRAFDPHRDSNLSRILILSGSDLPIPDRDDPRAILTRLELAALRPPLRFAMLGNAAPTPFDLRFSLFGIPVRVHPFFWLFTAAMGWDGQRPMYTLLWIACVFLSILVHEFGHALSARYFGWPPEVVLYSFGGYAQFHPGRGSTMQRSVLVLLAGPGAGFVLFGAVWCIQWLLIQSHSVPDDLEMRSRIAFVISRLKYINLWWGLVNLLPVYPLDGGQIARHVLEYYRRDGFEVSLKLSLLVGGAVAAWFLTHGQTWPGILFGALAFESLQHLQGSRYI